MASIVLLKSLILANKLQIMQRKKRRSCARNSKVLSNRHTSSKVLEVRGEMCRVCNQEKGEIAIFENVDHPSLVEDIQHFSGVTMTENDGLSQQMCKNCLKLLKSCIMFREICQNTNKWLIEQSIKKESALDTNIGFDDVNVKYLNNDQGNESDTSYNIPSPSSPDISCTYCDEQFADMAAFNCHSCYNKDKPAKVVKSKGVIKKGVRLWKFLCDICGKTAASNASLLVHMTTHENIFPFACEICPYRGRTRDLLKVHKRVHLAEKPFKCSQCPKTTTSASNLQKHMRHVHSVDKPYKCTYCEKAFSFQHDMKRHIKDIHLRQSTVECNICIKKFNTSKILRGHMFKVHKVKGERQGRLPSYLQCQLEEMNNDNAYHNME